MTTERAQVDGEPIGLASGLAIRFIFLRDIDWKPPHLKVGRIERIEDRDMKLHDLQSLISREADAKALCGPVQSFYSDITLTEEGGRRLPVVAACAAPKDTRDLGDAASFSPLLRVQIPGVIWTEWEGRLVDTQVVRGSRPSAPKPHEQYVPPLELICNFADAMSFFGSGHVAYSFSIILRPDSIQMPSVTSDRAIPVCPKVILSLLDLARDRDPGSHGRTEVKLGFLGDPVGLKEVHEFALHRLESLAEGVAEPRGMRPAPASTTGFADIYRAIIWPLRRHKGWNDPDYNDKRNSLAFGRNHLRLATCELVEFSEFERLRAYVGDSKEYKASADPFGKAVAGIAQNIIDFDNQDDVEVSDSLIDADLAGGYLHFVSSNTIVRFSKRSRSFDRVQRFIGGDPYFFFTTIACAYNEHLTNQAAAALSNLNPGSLIEASPYHATKAELEARYRIFAACVRPMIPNLFRYRTESALFDHIHKRRGITLRRETIESELSRYETIAHDFESLNLQRSNTRFNILVLVLALWSAFGALVAVSGLFVAMHSDVQPEKISELAVDYTKSFIDQLTEGSLWAAFIGLLMAIAASITFLAYTLITSWTRKRRT